MVRWDPERKVWRVSVAAYRPGERRRRQSRDVREPNTVDGRRAAELEEAKLKLEVAAVLELELPGGKVPDSFAAAAAAWVDRHPRWSPKTVKETRYALRRYILPTLGATRLDRVTPSQIEGMYADWARVGRADSTMHRWHGMIHSIFADAYRLGLVVKNPMDRVMAAGGTAPERMNIPSPSDVRRAIGAAASPTGSTFFELAAATGARRGTIVALRWRDVDLTAGTITFAHAIAVGEDGPVMKGTKANRPYAVHLPESAWDALRDHHRRASETALALEHRAYDDRMEALHLTAAGIRARKAAKLDKWADEQGAEFDHGAPIGGHLWRDTVCAICGQGYREDDPFEMAHDIAVAFGGGDGSTAFAHRSCNRGEGLG